MNPDPLDDLLRAYSGQPLPPPSQQAQARIWHEIEHRRRGHWFGNPRGLSWRELFSEPRLAIAALGVALVTGIMPAAAAHSFEAPRLARESLHLEVFTTCPSCVPANVLPDHRRR